MSCGIVGAKMTVFSCCRVVLALFCGMYFMCACVGVKYVHVWVSSMCMCGCQVCACVGVKYVHVWVSSMCMCGWQVCACVGGKYVHVWVASMCICASSHAVFANLVLHD